MQNNIVTWFNLLYLNNMDLHIICLTKSYNKLDFEYWYRYYRSYNAIIHIINNDSCVDIKPLITGEKDTYEEINGWPDQWNLFDRILNDNVYNFKNGDYVIFADDDEYFWFRHGWHTDIGNEFNITPLNVICVPQIYMSSMHLEEQRSAPYVLANYYRRNDFSSQGKSIIYYDSNLKYSFDRPNKEKGHIPTVKYSDSKDWLRMAKVVGSDVTKDSTYGITAYDADIRLYHYHLKSMDDWQKKWKRGSAACTTHPYMEDIKKNPGYDGYSTLDLTIKDYFNKL